MPSGVTERARMAEVHREQCAESECCYARGLADMSQVYADCESAPLERPFNATERVLRMVDAHREQCADPACCHARGRGDAIQVYGAPSERPDYAAIARRGAMHLVEPDEGTD